MLTYRDFCPTSFDQHLPLPDREDWLVLPVPLGSNPDPLQESNWLTCLRRLRELQADTDWEQHAFQHWIGPFFILLARPGSPAAKLGEQLESELPVLDEADFLDKQAEQAWSLWSNGFSSKERLDYIKAHPEEFQDIGSFRQLLANVRGNRFSGQASELLC